MNTQASTCTFRRVMAAVVGGCGLVAVLAFARPRAASAATIYWDGTSATWSTATAWSTGSSSTTPNPSAAPGVLDDAIFNITTASAASSTVTLGADQAARSMTFNTTGSSTLLAGGTARTLTLSMNGITLASGAGAVTLGNGLAGDNLLVRLRGGQTWTGSSASTFTINSTAAAFTRATGASLTFNQASTGVFAMSTTAAPNVNGILGPWAFFGTGFNTKYATNTTGTITGLAGTAAANATNLTDTTGSLNYDLASGTGTIGAANFSANTIRYTGGAATTAPGATSFSVNGLLNAGSGVWTIGNANPITIGSTKELVVNAANNGIRISSRILDSAGGPSSLTVLGSSTLALSGSNGFSGGVTLTRGTLQLQNSNAAGTGTILLAGNGTLLLDPGITVANPVQVDLDMDRTAITASGGGNTFLSGGITYTGTTSSLFPNINANGSGLFTISGGVSAPNLTGGAVSFRGNATGTNGGVVNGAVSVPQGGVDINGSANWTFNTAGGNYQSVSIQASSGGIILGVTDALATNARIEVNGNATGNLNMNGFNQSLAGLTGNAPNFSITNNSANSDSTLSFSGLTADRSFGGVIKDGATHKISLVVNSAGRAQSLSGTNTYTGTTTISAGTLRAGAAGGGQAFGSRSAVTIANTSGATLDLNSFSQTIGSLAGGGSTGGTVTTGTLASAVLTTGGDNTSTTFAGLISGSGGLTKAGSGTQILSGTNTFSGATSITAGILSITNPTALQGTSGVTIAGGAGLAYTGGTATFSKPITVTAGSGTGTIRNSGGGLLTLSGSLSKDNSVLRLTGGAFNVTGTISGTTAGASDLLVDGTSSITLSAANAYNGPTYVIESSTLAYGINNAIPANSVVTLGNATSPGTLTMNGYTGAIGGLAFGSAGGTLRLAATSTSAAPLTAASGTMTLTNGTLDLAGSGSTAGLYRVLSAQSIGGSFASITGTSAAYQVITSATSVDYQQRAVLGAVTATNPAVSIITGGSAAFTYTVANTALSGGANLAFTGSGLTNVTGSSSGATAAAGTSSAIAGLFFTGTTVGSGQTGLFTVSAPTAFGATAATGTVSVNVLNHSLASFAATDSSALSLNFGTYENGAWSGGGGGNGTLGFSVWNIASGGYLAADTAGLALYDVVFTSGTNIFSTGLTNFADLTAGTSNAYTASVLSPAVLDQGTYQGVYTLKFRDQQNLSGAANTRDLTLTMNVIVVPEPRALALAGIGIAAAGWLVRRRRNGGL